MGCSRGVPGLFRAVPGCSRGVPGMFRGVPGCSGFYRHPDLRGSCLSWLVAVISVILLHYFVISVHFIISLSQFSVGFPRN